SCAPSPRTTRRRCGRSCRARRVGCSKGSTRRAHPWRCSTPRASSRPGWTRASPRSWHPCGRRSWRRSVVPSAWADSACLGRASTAIRSRYLDALGREIAREGALLGRPRARTLFFGGGTPSLLEPAEIAMLGDALRRAFVLRPREVTLEANPATLDRARLEAWLALGLTRLSLGAQSFDARGLRALGRTHQPEDSAAA